MSEEEKRKQPYTANKDTFVLFLGGKSCKMYSVIAHCFTFKPFYFRGLVKGERKISLQKIEKVYSSVEMIIFSHLSHDQ